MILFDSKPELLFDSSKSPRSLSSLPVISSSKWESTIRSLVDDATREVLPVALKERRVGEEFSVTTVVTGNLEKLNGSDFVGDGVSAILDVHVHVCPYVVPAFGLGGSGAHLAVVGRGRDVAAAKYSDWVSWTMSLPHMRFCDSTFKTYAVVFNIVFQDKSESKGNGLHDHGSAYSVEVQTAPIGDGGVLKGVIRRLVIEVCLGKGIPVHEVAPSWANNELWEEAFITSSLRVSTTCGDN